MKYTLFLGCNIQSRTPQYQTAAQAVCKLLDIELIQRQEFICCGYPMRNINESSSLLSAAKNLAIAEQNQHTLMVLCKCCYGNLKIAQYLLGNNPSIQTKINRILAKESLTYKGTANIKHFLSVLHEDVGLKTLKNRIKIKYNNLKIAASVGCHALRPAKITKFDTPAAPTLFDDLVKVTGAKSIEWSRKSDCCGAALLGVNDQLSKDIMNKKLLNAKEAGANFISVACPYSFLQFDTFQAGVANGNGAYQTLGPVLYPQLLGLTMGIDKTVLGIDRQQIDISSLESYLKAED